MDDQEQEELLYRLDERTERIENEHLRRLNQVERDVGKVEKATESNEQRIQRNETVLKIMTAGVGGLMTAAVSKWNALLQFIRIA